MLCKKEKKGVDIIIYYKEVDGTDPSALVRIPWSY